MSVAEDMQNWALEEGEKLDAAFVKSLASKMTVNDVDLMAFVLASMPLYKDFASPGAGKKEKSL